MALLTHCKSPRYSNANALDKFDSTYSLLPRCPSGFREYLNKKKKENKQYKFFADAFHEVVIPVLEDMEARMATKDDIKELKEDIEGIDGRLDNVERKLEKIDDRLERYGDRIDNHEKRIGKLETKVAIAS